MIDWDELARRNAPLNAFVEWDRRAQGGEGALAGMTIGVKANIAVAGLAWTAGMALHRDRIAVRDAEVVARLRGAGAGSPGTLHPDEAALGAKTDNPWFGATQNPHRPGYTAGGSSGGSGAAVAAGLCEAALGSDTMGSIRIPAAYCGVYGLKPANDRVSQDGLELAEPSLDCIGPLARSLDMLERVARVISEFGGSAAPQEAAPGATRLRGSTISDLGGVECEPAVLDAFRHAAGLFEPLAEVALARPLSRIRYAGFIATARSMAGRIGDAASELVSPALDRLLDYGRHRAAERWTEDQAILAETAATVRAAVEEHGLMLLPTTPQPAFPHTEPAPANQADLTCLANIAGLPAISLPAGWSADGLPIAVQLLGRAGEEAALFAAARRLDAALAVYRPPAAHKEQQSCASSACST